MKRLSITLLTIVLFITISTTTFALPEGAVARLGKGQIGSGDRAVQFTVTTSRCDVNSDETVNIIDLVLVGKYLGASPPASNRADVNGNGTVDIQDLLLVSKHFGE